MTGRITDVFDVVGADRLLHVYDAAARWNLAAIEIFFKSGDAGIDPKQGFIALGD